MMVDTSSLSFSEEKVSGDGCSGAIAVSDLLTAKESLISKGDVK